MKKLILDRGFIDGRKISHCHQELGVQVLIPMKKKMDIWDDAWALGQTQPWLDVPVPASVPRPVPANRPPEIQRRENKRQQTLAARKAQEPPPPLSQQWQRTQVCPIKGFTSWSETTVPMHVLLQNDPGPAPTVLGCDFGHWEFLGPCVIAHWAFCNSWR